MERLLFVDDEPDLLAFYRQVFQHDFEVVSFGGGRDALDHLAKHPDYAVIVSDFSMPVMDGVEFLVAARELAPRSVRLILTGHASEDTAINAVNRGDIFKFLRKPIHIAELSSVVREAVQRHVLERAERDLLEQTLHGGIAMLTEALSLANPLIFGRSTHLKGDMAKLARRLKLDPLWELEAAAMLCEVGLLTQSDAIVHKIVLDDAMTPTEEQTSHAQAAIGANLVRKVPRLEGIADIILFQYKNFDGSGFPAEQPAAGTLIPIGARMLRALKDLRRAVARGFDREEVLRTMCRQGDIYDPDVVHALSVLDGFDAGTETLTLSVYSLQPGAVLARDIFSRSGGMIMREGQEISTYLAMKLHHFADVGEIGRDVEIIRQPAPHG